MRKLLLVLLVVATAALADEKVIGVPGLNIPRVTKAPTINQFLEGIPREAELHVSSFVQREPGDGVPVTQPTDAYLSYDDRNLYVIFVCKDDPAKIRAHLGKREQFDGDDIVLVLLDTFHDHQRATYFAANALGVQGDAVSAEGNEDDWSYDTIWSSEGRITSDGYIVWMAIPFRSLRFPRRPVQEWGIFLARFITRNNEAAFYPQLTKRLGTFLPQAGHAQGIENVSPGRNLQFIPYGFISHSRSLDPNIPRFYTDTTFRGGFDSKFVLHDSLTLDFTVNPDFSQIESDEPQVTVNQRYEVYFPERRPFFIENSDFFATPETLFFSRRIVDPEFGARLTGSLGRWKVAGLAIDDRAAGYFLPLDDPHRHDRGVIGVGRVKREFGKQNFLGITFTNRSFAGSYGRVAALDTRFVLTKNWIFTAQAIHSMNRPFGAAAEMPGNAVFADMAYSSRNWYVSTTYTDRTAAFSVPLGFVTQTDIRKIRQEFTRRLFPKHPKRLQRVTISTAGFINWDHRGTLQEWFSDSQFSLSYSRGTSFMLARRQGFERFAGLDFPRHNTFFLAETSPTRWLTAEIDYVFGRGINYQPAAGLAPFAAAYRILDTGFTLKPRSNVQVSLSYLLSSDVLTDSMQYLSPSARSIYNNHIARTKVNYQFTRRLSLRTIVDYNAVLPNSAIFAGVPSKRLAGDVLATYMVNPWTAVYVGYTDAYENQNIISGMLQRTSAPNVSTGRQFFAKVSYLFRF